MFILVMLLRPVILCSPFGVPDETITAQGLLSSLSPPSPPPLLSSPIALLSVSPPRACGRMQTFHLKLSVKKEGRITLPVRCLLSQPRHPAIFSRDFRGTLCSCLLIIGEPVWWFPSANHDSNNDKASSAAPLFPLSRRDRHTKRREPSENQTSRLVPLELVKYTLRDNQTTETNVNENRNSK